MAVPSIQTAFAAGEISPELYGEVNLAKYGSSASTILNAIVNYKGGALSRPGLAFVGRCKQKPPIPPRAIPFQFSNNQGYILEFGDNYIRFVFEGGYILEAPIPITGVTQANPAVVSLSGTPFANGDWVYASGVGGMTQLNGNTYIVAGVASGSFSLLDLNGNPVDSTGFGAYTSGGTFARIYTISTPYLAIDLPYLKFAQTADVMSLTLSNPVTQNEYVPQYLTRFAAADWTLTPIDFSAAIGPPATISAASNTQAPTNGINASFAYVGTAVDGKGNESVATPVAQCHGADLQVEAGTNQVTVGNVSGAKYYNFYRAPVSTDSGTTPVPVPPGSIFGFVGSSFGTQFTDNNTVPDLAQTPPLHLDPFARGQILGVNITGAGSGLTAVTWTITTGTGTGFTGQADVIGGFLGAFQITNNGKNYAAGDSIAFNGAGFASGAIAFGATNPSPGDTLTLNSVVWTFVSAITGTNQSLVGATLATTLFSLVAGLSGSSNTHLTVASYAVDGTNSNLLIQYTTAGTAGNAYTLAASRATPSGSTLTGGSGTGSMGSVAVGSLTFTVNPTAGQTIILNGITWTFVASGATGNQTNIGGSLSATLTALASNLNASVVSQIALSSYSATATALDIAYKTVGSQGNLYTLNAGTSGATPSGANLVDGTDASTVPAGTLVIGPNSGTYPGVNTYYQQRHFFANSLNNPDTIWATQTGLFNNMDVSIPTIATDAITAAPWTEQVNGIQWMIPMPGGMITMTGLRAWQVLATGGGTFNVQPITPASIEAQPQAFNGCSATIPPVVIDYDVLYVQAIGASSVFDLSYNFYVNIYTGTDLTILSSHLFLGRQIVQWAWARIPYKVLWSACDDGTLLSLTYLKEQSVFGWARHNTKGLVVSIASITEPPVNATYAITQRFPPYSLSGLGSSFTYTMSAEENYDPATVALWTSMAQPNYCFCDKQYIGTSFDRVRRNIMYSAVITNQVQDANLLVLETNTTGQTLWTGLSATPPGNTLDLGREFVFHTAIKNIDTGNVTFHNAYDPTQLVPSGIGAGGITGFTIHPGGAGSANGTFEGVAGSGDTGVRATLTYSGGMLISCTLWSIGAGNSVGDFIHFPSITGSIGAIEVTSVNTGSDGTTWGRSVGPSTLVGGDVLAICDPRTGNFWVHMESCELHIFRPSTNFAMEISPLQLPFTISENADAEGAPIGVTSNWVYFWAALETGLNTYTNYLQILPSSITSGERTADQLLATYTYAFPDDTYTVRQIVGPDANHYMFGAQASGTRNYKLWNCIPGTGFTDITPWSSSTGPNTASGGWTTNGLDTGSMRNYMIQLPASGNLALMSKLLPADYSTPGTDPTKFRVDCTYYHIAGGTFDYHQQMVYGYMDANWHVTNQAGAAFQVLDFLEFDNDLEVSDFVHSGIDYTTRRLAFVCKAMSGGSTVDGNQMLVFVDYHFVYGSAPTVVQVVPETGWDAKYTTYGGYISQSEVVAGSLPQISASNHAVYKAFAQNDNGIWDRPNSTMWLSGDDPQFAKFSPTFSPRYTQALNSWNFATAAASSPFLKLTLGVGSSGPGVYLMERFNDRIWQSVEDTYALDSAVSNPMVSPNSTLLATSNSGTGVTFTASSAVFSAGDVGQIIRMAGGIVTVTAYTDPNNVVGTWTLAGSNGAPGFPYAAAGDWTISAPVTTLHAPHLAGMTVSAFGDGVPISGLTVAADGTITLPFSASNVLAGLPYTVQIQTPYLNGDSAVQGARKVIPAATLRLAASGQFQIGTNQPDGAALDPPQFQPTWTNMATGNLLNATGGQTPPPTYTSPGGQTVTQLWTGDIRVVGGGASWISKGQVAVQQTLPLPLQVTAVIPETLPGETPEVRAQPTQAPQAPPQSQGPPQGQGPWFRGRGI